MKAYLYWRFSSTEQRKGNSRRRQKEWAEDWCRRKGIPLDETLVYQDAGVSGYRGKNSASGGLSLFLKACEEKRVAKGSYLIIENLDRLSREHPLDALALVRRLLKDFGIVLVTIHPPLELTASNLDMVSGVLMFVELARGHSESSAKSVRSIDNWQRKRAALENGAVITAKVPSWLVVKDGRIFVDVDKADIVRRIFTLSSQGFGQQVIAKRLNSEGVKPIGKAAIWHESYVQKLLNSRAVLGEYQPRRVQDGESVPVGNVVKDYFPRVVSDELWTASRNAMKARRSERGRISPKVSNLFTGLAYEIVDGEPLAVAYRSKAMKGYLQSATKVTPGILYGPFERVFLWWIKEVTVNLKQGNDYDTLKNHADILEKNINTLKARIATDPSLVDMLDTLASWKSQHKAAVEKMEAAAIPLHSHFLHGKRLVEALESATDSELETLRREVRLAIRQCVERVEYRTEPFRAIDRESAAPVFSLKPTKRIGTTVRVAVTMRDGSRHTLAYVLRKGRLVGGSIHQADSDPVEMVHEGEGFPFDEDKDGMERSELVSKCREMRAAGTSFKQIQAATGLHRVTIHRYLKGRR